MPEVTGNVGFLGDLEIVAEPGFTGRAQVTVIGGDVPDVADFQYLVTDLLGTGQGDGDLNRTINFDDFVILSNNFRSASTDGRHGNYNLDDVTDFDDFVVLSNSFGLTFTSSLLDLVPDPLAPA